MSKIPFSWELVEDDKEENSAVHHAKIIGGWLVQQVYYQKENQQLPYLCTQNFVPDPEWSWEI